MLLQQEFTSVFTWLWFMYVIATGVHICSYKALVHVCYCNRNSHLYLHGFGSCMLLQQEFTSVVTRLWFMYVIATGVHICIYKALVHVCYCNRSSHLYLQGFGSCMLLQQEFTSV